MVDALLVFVGLFGLDVVHNGEEFLANRMGPQAFQAGVEALVRDRDTFRIILTVFLVQELCGSRFGSAGLEEFLDHCAG